MQLDLSSQYRLVADSILSTDPAKAAQAIRQIPGLPPEVRFQRKTVSLRTQVRIFLRDGFNCTYCGRLVVFPPVLRLFSEYFNGINRDLFPYHPHGKSSETHLAFWRDMASCDHLLSVARGGGGTEENLVCALCANMTETPAPPAITDLSEGGEGKTS